MFVKLNDEEVIKWLKHRSIDLDITYSKMVTDILREKMNTEKMNTEKGDGKVC